MNKIKNFGEIYDQELEIKRYVDRISKEAKVKGEAIGFAKGEAVGFIKGKENFKRKVKELLKNPSLTIEQFRAEFPNL